MGSTVALLERYQLLGLDEQSQLCETIKDLCKIS